VRTLSISTSHFPSHCSTVCVNQDLFVASAIQASMARRQKVSSAYLLRTNLHSSQPFVFTADLMPDLCHRSEGSRVLKSFRFSIPANYSTTCITSNTLIHHINHSHHSLELASSILQPSKFKDHGVLPIIRKPRPSTPHRPRYHALPSLPRPPACLRAIKAHR